MLIIKKETEGDLKSEPFTIDVALSQEACGIYIYISSSS